MTINKKVFCVRIKEELFTIDSIVKRTESAWKRYSKTSDECYLDSVALNLQNFYTAIEKIFTMIGKQIEKSIPESSNWHSELLEQMTLEIDDVRPAVISKNTNFKSQATNNAPRITHLIITDNYECTNARGHEHRIIQILN